jgi:hypothetical protein
MVNEEDWEILKNSYTRYFQFSSSIENGIHAFNNAVDWLTNQDIDNIRTILRCIANQFGDLHPSKKEDDMKMLIDCINQLNKLDKDRKEKVSDIFNSLSEIPPNPTEEYHRPQTIRPHKRIDEHVQ